MAKYIMLNALNLDRMGLNLDQIEEYVQSRGGFIAKEPTTTTNYVTDAEEIDVQLYLGAQTLPLLAELSLELRVNGTVVEYHSMYTAQDSTEVVTH